MMDSGTTATNYAASRKLLEMDAAAFARDFNRRPFTFRHNLCAHPLMSLDTVRTLARSLQDRSEIYSDVNVSRIDQRWDETSRPRLSAEQLVGQIGAAEAWVVIRRAEMDPGIKLCWTKR